LKGFQTNRKSSLEFVPGQRNLLARENASDEIIFTSYQNCNLCRIVSMKKRTSKAFEAK